MRTFLSLLLVLAMATAACSGGGGNELGRVGDTTISMSDIEALYDTDSIPIDDTFRQTLFRLLAVEVVEEGLQEDFGVTIDEAEVDARFTDLLAQVETQGMTVADALGIEGASDEMLRFNARLEIVLDEAVRALLSDEGFLDDFLADEASTTTVCAVHILTVNEDEAVEVLDRLEAGEDFADVAMEVSVDTGSGAMGGDLGCSPAGRYVEPFAQATLEAPIGEVVGPVESQFGFHVIRVDSRESLTRDEVAADPSQYVPQQTAQVAFGEWFDELMADADVSVDEQYGTWTPAGIEPPTGE